MPAPLFLLNVLNIAELRLQRGSSVITSIATIMGDDYPTHEGVAYYLFDYWSTLSDDPPETIWPTDPDTGFPDVRTGRWLRIDAAGGIPQVNADWAATTGVAHILNKPTFATVATSGLYADLTGKPSFAAVAASGAYSDLSGKPTIPAAQVNSDWSASSGISQILNKPSLATVATSGSYNDLSNKPTIPTVNTPAQSAASRSLNTAFQISSTRAAYVSYSVKLTVTASITGGQDGDVFLEIASDSGFTANVQTIAVAGLGQTYTLAVALQGVQPQTGCVFGFVPAGYYVRLRTVNNTGTPTYSVRAGQEVLV